MRKAIAGILIGCVALSGAAGAVAATSAPMAPVKPVSFGELNNRAVLGLAATQAADCTPDSAGNGCTAGGEGGSFFGPKGLIVVTGIGAVAVGVALASSGSPSSP